jgi:hypothetical protein
MPTHNTENNKEDNLKAIWCFPGYNVSSKLNQSAQKTALPHALLNKTKMSLQRNIFIVPRMLLLGLFWGF